MIEQILTVMAGASATFVILGAFVLMLWPERRSPVIEREYDIVPRIK